MQSHHNRRQRGHGNTFLMSCATAKEGDSRIRSAVAGQEGPALPGCGSIRPRSTRPEAVHSTEAARGISEGSPLMGRGQGRRRRCASGRTTSRMALCGPTQSTAARCKAGIKRTAYRSAARGQSEVRLGRLRATTACGSTEATGSCQPDRRDTHLDDQPEDRRRVVHAERQGFRHRPRTPRDRTQPG